MERAFADVAPGHDLRVRPVEGVRLVQDVALQRGRCAGIHLNVVSAEIRRGRCTRWRPRGDLAPRHVSEQHVTAESGNAYSPEPLMTAGGRCLAGEI